MGANKQQLSARRHRSGNARPDGSVDTMTINLPDPPLDKAELDFQLSPSRSSKHVPAIFAEWRSSSADARRQLESTAVLDLAYGGSARQRLDVFTGVLRSVERPRPILVFIHGGFWQEGTKSDFHFPAPAFVKAGWIYVSVGYSLAPHASLSQIVAEIHDAIDYIKDRAAGFGGDPERIVVSGHSAGGHLAACLAIAGVRQHKIAGIAAISGVFDLEPIRRSYVNGAVRIDDEEVALLSPALRKPGEAAVQILVGALESPEFIRQSQLLALSWDGACASLNYELVADADHFSILLGLGDPSSRIFRSIAGMPGISL